MKAGLIKLYFMHLIINEESKTTTKPINKYKLYNLLFNGRISLKEYLNALLYLQDNNSEWKERSFG